MNELKEKTKDLGSFAERTTNNDSPLNFSASKPKNTKKKIIIALLTILAIVIIALLVTICINLQSTKIFGKVIIDGVEVGNLTKTEAIEKLTNSKQAFSDKKLKLLCQGVTVEVSNNDISGTSEIEKAVEEAYAIGRYSNIFNNNLEMIKSNFSETSIASEYIYDEQKLDALVASITDKLPQLKNSSYAIKDNELIIDKGTSGQVIANNNIKEEIVLALQTGSQEEIQIDVKTVNPDEINLQKIHDEIYKAPKDATYKKDPFEIVPHEVGVDFAITVDEAQEILEGEFEKYIIPLKLTNPEVTTDEIGTEAFPDLLSSFQTTYIQSKVNRTHNLKLASNSINGVVIMPGETFSYNKTLGPRTVAAGYKMAGVYSGGEVVDGLGGGICQISSNLYNIVLLANLEIVERHNHQFLPGYVPAGQDATVVYGALDFKFKNNRNYPVKIESSVGNGYVKMKLYGVKEEGDYEVVISTTVKSTIYPKTVYEDTDTLAEGQTKVKDSGQNGCKSVTYKILKKNGKEVSREKLSEDTYSAMKKVVLRGTKKSVETNTNVNTNPDNNNSTTEGNNNPTSNETNVDKGNTTLPENNIEATDKDVVIEV